MVRINDNRYGEFTPLLDNAMQAYTDGLGAGAVVYLRKIFEKLTVKTAEAVNIEYAQYDGGNPKNFSELLKRWMKNARQSQKNFLQTDINCFES